MDRPILVTAGTGTLGRALVVRLLADAGLSALDQRATGLVEGERGFAVGRPAVLVMRGPSALLTDGGGQALQAPVAAELGGRPPPHG
ncbi:hypothetical protein ACIHFE_30890 [Streptomyces sp. NPDC052396]|uniref:hypothetical protein n=1 Tax=Streptomyces sp. NPDC052396 TaxID=3365689 RepID=UPI0037D03110